MPRFSRSPQTASERRQFARLKPRGDSYARIDGRDVPLRNWTNTGFLAGPYNGTLVAGQKARVSLVVRDWHDPDGKLQVEGVEVVVLRIDRYGIAVRFYRPERYKANSIREYFDRKNSKAAH